MYSDQALLKSLKTCREQAGLTQKQVEAKLDLRPLAMRDYEVGRLKLPITVAVSLAQLYDISVDQLVGLKPHPSELSPSQFLANFSSLFAGGSQQLMLIDPILRAFVDDHRDDFFDQSMFEVLTSALSEADKKQLIVIVGQVLFSLAGCDGKVSDEEIRTIKYILSNFNMMKSYKEISTYAGADVHFAEIPKAISSIEIRHFLLWLLFLFANTDGKITEDELKFIEARAEELKINKSNYLFIRGQFVKENQ